MKMRFQTFRVKPWMYLMVICIILVLIVLNWRGNNTDISEERNGNVATRSAHYIQAEAPVATDRSNFTRFACSLTADESTDPAFKGFVQIASVLDELCKQNNVIWMLWGDVSLRLHQIGARLLKAALETHQTPNFAEFEIVLASEKAVNIMELMKSLTERITVATDNKFNCEFRNLNGDQNVCSAMLSRDESIKIRVIGPAIIDHKTNEFRLEDGSLLLKHSFKLHRVFPLREASYYGVRIPVPKEPVYVFSHSMPSLTNIAASTKSYKYTQGCSLIFERLTQTPNQNEVIQCGKVLHELGYTSLYQYCSKTTPEEERVPLNKLIESQPGSSVYLMEDFKDVIIVDKGTGEYNLSQPNGLKQISGVPSWSQFGQDRYVDNLFQQKRNGFFLEIGAHDGEHFSNTMFFEKLRDWDGLLIEAIPSLYSVLKSKNRKCYSTNVCISTDDDSLIFTVANFLSSSKKHMPNEHKNRIEQVNPKIKANTLAYEVLVHCKPLMSILDKIDVHYIDYFSLDVEGSELIILNAIQWDKVDIELFTIETDHHREEILDFMKAKGYHHIKQQNSDDIFQKIRPLVNAS